MEIPMLDDNEWDIMSPLLTDSIQRIKKYRQDSKTGIAEASTTEEPGAGIPHAGICAGGAG
jgi:hypothetical protein